MKHKNELRWLAFLLIPFNILFAIHIIAPLQFISSNGHMLEQYAGEEQLSSYRYTTTSYMHLSRRTLNSLFQKYVFTLHTLSNLFWSSAGNSSYIHYKNKNKTTINAFGLNSERNKSITSNTTKLNPSMWFSSGVQHQDQLSPPLKALFQHYSRIDPYIRQLVSQSDSLVYSFIYYSVDANQSIYFQYPAQVQSRFNNISVPVLDYFYDQTMKIYLANNKSLSIVPFIQNFSNQNISLVVLCMPSQNQNQSKVICLKLKAKELECKIRSSFSPLNFTQLNFTYYLLMNPDFLPPGTKPTYIIFGQNQENNSQQFAARYLAEIAIDLAQKNKAQVNQQNLVKQYQMLYYYQLDFTVYFFSPITIDPFNINSTQFFIVSVIQLDKSVVLNQRLAINFPALLLPVTLLVVIASILCAYAIKRILNTMEQQLYALDQPCKFIVDGNLDVQIADYQGVKEFKQLYQKIKIVNKIHRYSSQSYFTGHFSEKLLKYAEALQFLKGLGYKTGNLLQNMGQAYTHIQQWSKGREALKESITLALEQIEKNYGAVNEITKLKKERKMPLHYKQLELILIRRLFKICFNYLIYLEQRPSLQKFAKDYNSQSVAFTKTDLQLNNQCLNYLKMLKMAFYPDFTSYSECIIMLYYEANLIAKLNNFSSGKNAFNKVDKLSDIYCQNYFKNRKQGKQGKQKSFINCQQREIKKIYQLKRKSLSHYSKVHPDILMAFKNYFRFSINQLESKDKKDYVLSVNLLCQSLTAEFLHVRLYYLSLLYLRNTLKELKIETTLLESTQIFRQMIPFVTLHDGQNSEEAEAELFKLSTKTRVGLEREFVLIFDCGRNYVENDLKLVSFHAQRAEHLHEKLIKPTDRVSIMKFNARRGVEVQCKLLMKDTSDFLLRKSVSEIVRERSSSGFLCPGVIEVLIRSVERVKHLRSEKVVIFFFRSVQQYREQLGRVHRTHAEKKSAVSLSGVPQDETLLIHQRIPEKFGEWAQYMLQEQGLKNLKLVLYCAKEDSREDLEAFFGLQEINYRICRRSGGVNTANNLVYIIEDKYRSDIDRILMLKAENIPDNHIFVL